MDKVLEGDTDKHSCIKCLEIQIPEKDELFLHEYVSERQANGVNKSHVTTLFVLDNDIIKSMELWTGMVECFFV